MSSEFNTAEIENLTKLISEYSALIVGCAIIFVAFILILIFIMKQSQKNMQSIADLNKQLVNKLLEEDEERKCGCSNSVENNLVMKHTEINEELQKQLKILRDETDCDRTFVFLFHNGEYSVNMFPFLKATCFMEWKLYTIRPTLTDQRAIPVSILTPFCNDLIKYGKWNCKCVEDLQEEEPMMYVWLRSKDSKSFFGRALKDENKNIIGFVACDYVTTDYTQAATVSKIEESLRMCSLIISPLLRIQ